MWLNFNFANFSWRVKHYELRLFVILKIIIVLSHLQKIASFICSRLTFMSYKKEMLIPPVIHANGKQSSFQIGGELVCLHLINLIRNGTRDKLLQLQICTLNYPA